MADNTTLNAGAGGDVIATDEVGGTVKYQVIKLALGGDGVAAFAPTGAGTEAGVLRVTLPTDGTGVVSLSASTLAALESLTTVSTVTTVSSVTAIANALPAGNNNIGDVDVLSVVPGTGATNLGKAVDSVAGATDTGIAPLFVRQDTLSTITPVVGDYAPGKVDSQGCQYVRVVNGVLGIADDSAFVVGTTEVLPVGMYVDETAPDSADEHDLAAPRITPDRKQYVVAHQETGSIYQNGVAKAPAFAAISGATNGDNTLVAAAGSGNKIRVTSLYLVAAGTTTVRFESGAGGTALSGVMSLVANTGLVLPHNPNGWFETSANTLLNMELNAAVQVSGGLSYIVVT